MPRLEWRVDLTLVFSIAVLVIGGLMGYAKVSYQVDQLEANQKEIRTRQQQFEDGLGPKIDALRTEMAGLRAELARAQGELAARREK